MTLVHFSVFTVTDRIVSFHLHEVKLFSTFLHWRTHPYCIPSGFAVTHIAGNCKLLKFQLCVNAHQLSYSVTLKLNSDISKRLNAAHAEEMLMVKCAEPKIYRMCGHLIALDYFHHDENQVDWCKNAHFTHHWSSSLKSKFCKYVLDLIWENNNILYGFGATWQQL